MKSTKINFAKLFLNLALLSLFAGMLFGCLSATSYLWPGFLKNELGFISMRPFHVSAVLFWILLGGTFCIYYGIQELAPDKVQPQLAWVQWELWVVAIIGISYSYAKGDFGGREYWEFNPIWALPIALSWLIFIIQYLRIFISFKPWPVYMWMWTTGLFFFLFTFLEGYLWTIPYFRNSLITDLTIQWKVNGSMVGSWNQIIYGTAIFLMDKLSGQQSIGKSKTAFALYFLGFFNLCFNWGHHIYTLPTASYIRYVGYVVSMTEWIFFIKIVYNWKQDIKEIQTHYSRLPYRFIMAANLWVFLNLTLALFMSIPAINLYTHGTHVTVAHAMGTTIGINSMLLLAAAFSFYETEIQFNPKALKRIHWYYWILQGGLLIFWLSLLGAGIAKGLWQLNPNRVVFGEMMNQMKPWFVLFFSSGILIYLAFTGIVVYLWKAYFLSIKNRSNGSNINTQ